MRLFQNLSAVSIFVLIVLCVKGQSQIRTLKTPPPSRLIEFTTDEGSYMDVEVSPDDKTLLFTLLGDIYSVPVIGGPATQLTRGLSLHARPVFSPDHKQIAYISDSVGVLSLHITDHNFKRSKIIKPVGGQFRLNSNIIWEPSCNFIYIDGSIYDLVRNQISGPKSVPQPLKFSQDGNTIFYIDSSRLLSYNFRDDIKLILSDILQGASDFSVSADGQWFSFVIDSNNHKKLMVEHLTSKTSKVLVSDLIVKDIVNGSGAPLPRYSFSADSKSIFISFAGKIHKLNLFNESDTIVPFKAHVRSDLGSYIYNRYSLTHENLSVKYIRSSQLSPNGKSIVFSALNTVFQLNIQSGLITKLCAQNANQYQPAYSPDGKHIAYVSWSDTIGGQLWRVASEGGIPELLTKEIGQFQRPTWSPDGKSVAVIKGPNKLGDRDDPGSGQLQIIQVNNGRVRVVDDSIPLWNVLSFSTDGGRIFYTPRRSFQTSSDPVPVLVSKLIEENKVQIVAKGTDFSFIQQKILSPDNRFIVYSADEDIYLIPVIKMISSQLIDEKSANNLVIKFSKGFDPCWDIEGKVLSWTYANCFYSIDPSKIMDAAIAECLRTKNLITDRTNVEVQITPDRKININLNTPRSYAKGMVVLANVKILTMTGKVINDGSIVIKDGRIAEIKRANKSSYPRNATVFNLDGKIIMPGIVDLHDHMRIPPNIFPQQSWMFLANLAYGITTARDPSQSLDGFGYRELLETGSMIGPRLVTVGRAARLPDGLVELVKISDARSLVQKRAAYGGISIKQYKLPTRQQREWLAIACRDEKLNMTNEGDINPIADIAMIKDGSTGIEHSPRWGDAYRDIITLFALSKTFITPTLQIGNGSKPAKEYFKYKYWRQPDVKLSRFAISDPTQKGPTDNGAESIETIMNSKYSGDTTNPDFIYASSVFARIRNLGGNVTLGSHGNNEGIGAHNELWALKMGGLTNMQALQAATILGAQALGLQNDLGSIQVGKIADLIIMNKNPLDDIFHSRDILYVMKDGILYDANTLDQFWPERKKCPEWKLSSVK